MGFNTIQYDIDLKLISPNINFITSFNTIQYDIDLKQIVKFGVEQYVLIPFNMT